MPLGSLGIREGHLSPYRSVSGSKAAIALSLGTPGRWWHPRKASDHPGGEWPKRWLKSLGMESKGLTCV